MYLPTHFQAPSQTAIDQLVIDYPLATLVVVCSGEVVPWAADPVPMLCQGSLVRGASLWGHVAKANPLWRNEGPATAVFTGPRAYVSPNAYPSKRMHHKVVPTYNYATVQASGRLVCHHDPETKRAMVQRLTDTFERDQPAPWSVSDAPLDYIDMMVAAIVVVELQVQQVQAKWKASQNRSVQDQTGVAAALFAQSAPSDAAAMAGLIQSQLSTSSHRT